jgi:chloramphenicol 3-O-phosphotransferase
MRWRPYDEMSRLEQKMFWAVRESTMLHELPLPEVDDSGSHNEVRWPAESPADCADVLLAWFDAGLVGVMITGTDRDLPEPEAREVLANYAAWSPTYSLTITDAGEAALV